VKDLDSISVRDYLRRVLDDPELSILDLAHIVGGASRHTWSVNVRSTGQEAGETNGIILRMDPEASVLESGRHIEYTVYRALATQGAIPVPEVIAIEDDAEVLGQTFFAMRKVEGSSSIAGVADPERADRRGRLFPQVVSVLVELSRIGPCDVGLPVEFAEPVHAWEHELSRWEAVVRRDELEPQLVTHAAIRWLRRHPPRSAESLRLVHGDLRTGNYMYDDEGQITAVLDWEMAHLGDPLETLGWFCSRAWRLNGAQDGDVGSLCSGAELIRAYEQAAGVMVDLDSLYWWELLGLVKLNALFMTGAAEFAAGRTRDPSMALMSIASISRVDSWLLEEMGW
jgi:aminoglycoside phosphotransferase (APT) family kinase protein